MHVIKMSYNLVSLRGRIRSHWPLTVPCQISSERRKYVHVDCQNRVCLLDVTERRARRRQTTHFTVTATEVALNVRARSSTNSSGRGRTTAVNCLTTAPLNQLQDYATEPQRETCRVTSTIRRPLIVRAGCHRS